MSGGSTVQHIDTVDAIARSLYLRAKQSGLPFSDVANAVRNLHLALRHLRTEAGDQDSLLNNPHASSSSLYARQLSPLVEDCDFTLAQLESLLDKYGDGRAAMSEEERLRDDRLAIMKSKLVGDKTRVEMFLDAVQLHAENRPARVVDGSQEGFEGIKDKIDEIANKLFRNRSENSFTEDDDDLWREFKEELEKEGFSPQVLRKHKDVLRAYIRELESVQNQYGGNCPTVRGLLEQEAKYQPSSPKELDGNSYVDYPPVIVSGRRRSNSDTTRDHISSSPRDSDNESDFSTALVSTKDIISMDSLNSRMASLNVKSGQQYSLSPGQGQRYLPSNSAGSLPDVPELSSSPTSYHFGASPRSMPPMPPHMNGGPTYGSSPRSSAPRLAPDRWGNEIPLMPSGPRLGGPFRAMRDPRRHRHDHHQDRRDSKSSREDDDSDSDLFDESDISDDDEDRASDKGTKSYPFIVNPPSRSKTSPSSTTLPKPILKNKNENHVRFDPEPHEVDGRSPRSLRDERDRERDYRRERRRHSPSRSSRRSRRHSDAGDRYSRSDRHGDYYDSNGRRYHRERDRKSSRRDERPQGRKKWGRSPRRRGHRRRGGKSVERSR
ncbi:hypothetical protein NW754_005285 [Fusarium falciforme]|nr:hypothetical protein NW754_005285 [Fusarium falciforme]